MPMEPEPEHALALLLRQADRRMSARLDAVLASRGSSLEQWHVLSCLSDGAGRAMSEIGAVVMLPAPTMSKLVDSLVAVNLVHRRADARDRRRVLVLLTARGVRRHRELSLAVEQEARLRELHDPDRLGALNGQLVELLARLDAAGTLPAQAPVQT